MHIIANDPSMAFYRIQEHVRKVLPLIVDRKAEVLQLQQDLQGHCYDIDYAVGYVLFCTPISPDNGIIFL